RLCASGPGEASSGQARPGEALVVGDQGGVVLAAVAGGGQGGHHLAHGGGEREGGAGLVPGGEGVVEVLDVQVEAESGGEVGLQHLLRLLLEDGGSGQSPADR